MGSFSMMHWVIVALVVLVLFGRGKISETMGDFGKGIRSFRKGLSDDDGKQAGKQADLAKLPPSREADAAQQRTEEAADRQP